MADEAPELLPCPWCGPSAKRKPHLHKSKGVKCHECGAWGPAFDHSHCTEWNTRADLCDPMKDERVKRLVKASARLEYVARQNTDDALEWEGVCEDVRAALTAALATQEAPND